jgi:hypothetical protein
MSTTNSTTDLTQRPPRSPRVRLGGYVFPPRILDKGRASVAGKIGEYHLRRTPDSDHETLTDFADEVKKFSATREDINTWFDLLDLDDYCSFGGNA